MSVSEADLLDAADDAPAPRARDPTRSKTRRDRWERRFRSRARDVQQAARAEFHGQGRGAFHPQADRSRAVQQSEFDEWAADVVDELLVEPERARSVRRGGHYTGAFIREFYEHGLRQARRHLRRAGYPVPDATPDQVLRADERDPDRGWHTAALNAHRVEAYRQAGRIGRDTTTALSDAYADALAERANQRETIGLLTGAVGTTAFPRLAVLAQTVGVSVVNTAALRRYAEVGVEEVGVDIDFELSEISEPDASPSGDVEQNAEVFRTAGDDRVCEECAALEGEMFRTADVLRTDFGGRVRDERAPRPPIHARCRCLLVPVPLDPSTLAAGRAVPDALTPSLPGAGGPGAEAGAE